MSSHCSASCAASTMVVYLWQDHTTQMTVSVGYLGLRLAGSAAGHG